MMDHRKLLRYSRGDEPVCDVILIGTPWLEAARFWESGLDKSSGIYDSPYLTGTIWEVDSNVQESMRYDQDVTDEVHARPRDFEDHIDPSGKTNDRSKIRSNFFWLARPDLFDDSFFDMSPIVAPQADPATRLALLTSYDAVERAGILAGEWDSHCSLEWQGHSAAPRCTELLKAISLDRSGLAACPYVHYAKSYPSMGGRVREYKRLSLGPAAQPDWRKNCKEKQIEKAMGVFSALASMASALRHLHETPASTLCDHRDVTPTNVLIPSVRSAKTATPMTWERARATSAAPAYLEPIAFDSLGDKFVDGGLSLSNPIKLSCLESQLISEQHPGSSVMTSIGAAVKPEEVCGGPLKQEHGARWLVVFDGVDGALTKDLSDYKRVLEKDFGFSVRGWPRHTRDPDDHDEDAMTRGTCRRSRVQKGIILLTSPGLISLMNNYATHRHVAKDLPEVLRQVAMLMRRKVAECELPGIHFLSRPSPQAFLAAAVGLTIVLTKLRYLNDHPSWHVRTVFLCIGATFMYGVSMKMPLMAIALYVLPWAAYVGCLLAQLLPFFLLGAGKGENSLEGVHRAGGGCLTNEEHMMEV